MSSSSSSTQPNATLYLNNLNDKITKEELKGQLYALFSTYGKIIDIVALKGRKMKGQAFLVFSDLAGATTAMRSCEGMLFYDKPLVRQAPSSSQATLNDWPSAYCLCKNEIVRDPYEGRSRVRASKCSECKLALAKRKAGKGG